MGYALVGVATSDDYTPQATLACHGAVRLRVQVFNAGAIYQLGVGNPPVFDGSPEKGLGAGVIASLQDRADGVRFRSRAAGRPARVDVDAVPATELGPA